MSMYRMQSAERRTQNAERRVLSADRLLSAECRMHRVPYTVQKSPRRRAGCSRITREKIIDFFCGRTDKVG